MTTVSTPNATPTATPATAQPAQQAQQPQVDPAIVAATQAVLAKINTGSPDVSTQYSPVRTDYNGNSATVGVPAGGFSLQGGGDDLDKAAAAAGYNPLQEPDAPDRNFNVSQHLAYITPGIAAAAVDTVGRSIGLLSKDSVDNFMKNYVGGDMGDYYTQYKKPLSFATDMGILLIPGMIGAKAIETGSILYKAAEASKLPYVTSLFANGEKLSSALESLQLSDLASVKNMATNLAQDPVRKAAVMDMIKTSALNSVKRYAASESAIALTMNQSDNIYPDDWSVWGQIAMHGVGAAASVGIDYAILRSAIRRSLTRPEVMQAAADAREGVVSGLGDVAGRPGNRDFNITRSALAAADMKNIVDETSEQELKTNANKFYQSYQADLQKGLEMASKDGISGVIKSSATDSDINMMTDAFTKNPTLGVGLQTFTPLPSDINAFRIKVSAAQTAADETADQIDTLTSRIMQGEDMFSRIRPQNKKFISTPERMEAINTANNFVYNRASYSPEDLEALRGKIANFQNQIAGGQIPADKTLVKKLAGSLKLDDAYTKLASLRDQVENQRNLTTAVIEPGGDMINANDRRFFFQDFGGDAPSIKTTTRGGTVFDTQYGVQNGQLDKTIFGSDFAPNISANLLPDYDNWVDLTPAQRSAYYAIGQKVTQPDLFLKGRAAGQRILLNEDSDPFVLDMARQAYINSPKAVNEFNLPLGVNSTNFKSWIEQTSLAAKYDKVFVPMMQKFEAQGNNAFFKQSADQALSLPDIAHALNLPNGYYGNQHPVFNAFRSMYMQGDTKFADAVKNFSDFQRMVKTEAMQLPGGDALKSDQIDFLRAKPIDTMGNWLNRPQQNGQFVRSQIAFYKPQPYDLTAPSMQSYQAAQKMAFLAKFDNAPPFIANLTKQLLGDSAFQAAADTVHGLVDGQQAGRGVLFYQNMATRDIPGFTAVDMVSKTQENYAAKAVENILGSHAEVWTQLRQKENNASARLVDMFVHSRRFGFELEEEPEFVQNLGAGSNSNLGGKFYTFPLKTNSSGDLTERNVQALERFFKGNVPEDVTHLPMPTGNGTYSAVRLDDLAFKGVSAIKDVNDQMFSLSNFWRKLYGRSEITYQNWHVPPVDLSNQYIRFIIHPAEEGGQPVKMMVTGRTADELNRRWAQPGIQDYLKEHPQALAVDYGDTETYFNLRDEAFHNMWDMSDPLAQTGKATGASGSPDFQYGPHVLNDILGSLEQQTISHSKRTVAALMEDQLRQAAALDRVYKTGPIGPMEKGSPSIYQMYANRMLGISALKASNSPLAIDAKNEAEMWNGVLQKAFEAARAFLPNAADRLVASSPGTARDFEDLRKLLGGHLPYSDTAEFINNTYKVGKDLSAEGIAHTLNAVTANLTLRILDAGNGLISILGNLVSMPLVMNAMKRNNYGTQEEWLHAQGLFGAAVNDDYIMPNPVRWMSKSVQYLFSNEGQRVMDEARALGNIRPTMIAAYEALHRPFDGSYTAGARKLVNYLSIPSDRGEMASRMWAYTGGYLLAKDAYKIKNAADLHSFANYFADQVIANYRPSQKPLIFQGLFGSPMGLFQTYMYNYYGRMFKYIENRDYRSLAVNYALQGGLFGIDTVPGYQQFNDLYTMSTRGDDDPVDALDRNFGHNTADWIMHGAVSNFPKVFGAKDGVALYSRMDANQRKMPAYLSFDIPALNMGENIGKMLWSQVEQILPGGQPSTQRTLEALGTYSASRPIGRMMELAAGKSVDQYGNVVNEDTRTWASVISRMLSMRPMLEDQNIKAYSRIATHEAYQQAMNERIDTTIRALMRDPNVSEQRLDNGLAQAMMDHIKNGGNPMGAAEFLRNAVIASQLTKNEKKLLGILNNPSRTQDVMRLISNIQDYQE